MSEPCSNAADSLGRSATEPTPQDDGMDLFDFHTYQLDGLDVTRVLDGTCGIRYNDSDSRRIRHDAPQGFDDLGQQALMDAQLHRGYEAYQLDKANGEMHRYSQHPTESSGLGGQNEPPVSEGISAHGFGLSKYTAGPVESLPCENIASDETEEDEMSLQKIVVESRRSHTSQNPLQCMTPPLSTLKDNLIDDAKEQTEMEHVVEEGRRKGLFQEKWQVDKECASLIASVVSVMESDRAGPFVCNVYHRCKGLRLEEAVLLTHPEADVKAVLDRNRICVTAAFEKALPYRLDIEKDEALAWSAKALAGPTEVNRRILSEKLQIDRETMQYLRQLDSELECSLRDYTEAERRRKAVPRASPVVLPLSPPLSPALLPLEIAKVELTSTPDDPSLREAAVLDGLLAERDQPHLDDADIGRLSNEELPLVLLTPMRTDKTRNAVKVSSPLLPCNDRIPESPLPDAPHSIACVDEFALIPSPETSSTDAQAGVSFSAEIKEICGPMAATAVMKLDQEDLIEADTTMRVPVPELHVVKHPLPWETAANDESLIAESVKGLSEAEKRWTGASKLEKTLSWRPFPSHHANLKPEGDFDDGSCARFLAELALDDDIDIRRLTWKPEGLRVLDSDEDQEENLEHIQQEEEAQRPESAEEGLESNGCINAMQSHRPLALPNSINADPTNAAAAPLMGPTTAAIAHQHGTPRKDSLRSVPEVMLKRKLKLQQESAAKRARGPTRNAGDGTTAIPAGVNAMEHFGQFLNLQGQVQLPGSSGEANASGRPEAITTQSTTTAPTLPLTTTQAEQSDTISNKHPNLPIPTPQINTDNNPKPIILSSHLLTNRQLLRYLQTLLPTLDLTSRDSLSPQSREADIILSPSTGVILTTLQKLKQKALPGQKDYFSFREQVQGISLQYEKLVVLVGEGGQEGVEVRGLEERDAEIVGEFMGQMARVSCEIQVVYVPGGEQEMVRWIAALICRYTPADQDVKLLQEETFWERFLRQAGLNVYAAQAVLAKLKLSDEEESLMQSSPEVVGGLMAFVLMEEEERVQRFGPMMGGETVLRRVSRNIDARWKSAANVR